MRVNFSTPGSTLLYLCPKDGIELSNDQYLQAVETISAPTLIFELNNNYPYANSALKTLSGTLPGKVEPNNLILTLTGRKCEQARRQPLTKELGTTHPFSPDKFYTVNGYTRINERELFVFFASSNQVLDTKSMGGDHTTTVLIVFEML